MEQRLDPISFEVVSGALHAAAREMTESLGRSAYSPIIREMLDYACAIFDDEGRLVAQGETIPAMIGSMGHALRILIQKYSGQVVPGDIYIHNDPFTGGTHTPDIHLFMPVFAGSRLLAWCATLAHHVDVGGPNPGTEGFHESIFAEGIRFPALKLYEAGRLNQPLLDLLAANVREPRTTLGDLRAQIAACRTGGARLAELADRYGPEGLTACMAESIAYAERRMRAGLEGLTDGVAAVDGYLDDDGAGGRPVRIHLTLAVKGAEVVADFTGSDPAIRGGMNVPYAAMASATLYAVKCVVDPDAPLSEGCFRPIRIIAPEGSVVNARFPAAVSLRHLAVLRIADTLLRAFAELYPEQSIAGCFVGFSSVAIEGTSPRTGHLTVLQDDLGGGMGAGPGADGLGAVDQHLGNVGILPVEVCELQYPVRIGCTELIPDSGGAGRWRGGLGIRREYLILDHEQRAVAYTEQSDPQFAPWGLAGGRPGRPARVTLVRADGTRQAIRKATFIARPGDRIVLETGGGGGFGDPALRDSETVRSDLADGLVTDTEAYTALREER